MRRLALLALALVLACSRETPAPPQTPAPSAAAPPAEISTTTRVPELQKGTYDEALLWFRMSEASNTGIGRVLARHGARPLGYVSHRCEPAPKREGANALWGRCRVRRVRAPGDTVEERLFGSVVSRGGRYKFVSYANDR